MTEVFGLRATLPAPPAPVFHALTDPGTMRGWLAEHAEVSLAEERYEFWGRTTPQGEPGRQRLLTAEPDCRLGFEWTLDGVKTTVDMSLAPAGTSTELILRHEPMPTLDELMAPEGPPRRPAHHAHVLAHGDRQPV